MKLALFLGLALVAHTIAATSVFRRNFNELHKEPPPQEADGNSNRASPVEILWIEQKLDHYDPENNDTWFMRYMENPEYFEPGGPIFVYVGGEWEISAGSISGGHIVDMAKEHKGMLYYTEHRYYGRSKPTENLSTENMKYLNVKQALHDLAYFIETQKKNDDLINSKVILVGGSYSATMVTWFKRMFPALADGCWASSAPLLAKVNFVEYKEVTGQSIKLVGGQACYDRIENGIKELEDMFENNRSAEVKALLKLCNNFNPSNELDIWTLFSEISDMFAGVVQNHNGRTIQSACNEIMSGEDDVAGLTKYVLRRTYHPESSCTDMSYSALLDAFGSTEYTGAMMRQWIYQTCMEYGWYQTSGSTSQPFGTKFPVELYTTMCSDVYGTHLRNLTIYRNADETNQFFGGLNPGVSNVYMSHGQLDPWRAMGVQDSDKATIIPLHAHCKDFGSISPNDTPELRASKERVAELVRQWVKVDGPLKRPHRQLF